MTTDIWAIDRGCVICDQTGWVCENHADKPWDGVSARSDACGCGAGMPCTCNPLSKDTGVTDAASSLRHHAG